MSGKLVLRMENVSGNVTEENLRELVQPFGVIAKIHMPRPTLWLNVPLGRVELMFSSENDAVNAYAHLQGATVDGSKIELSFVRITEDAPVDRRRSSTPRRKRSASKPRRRRDSRPKKLSPKKRGRSRSRRHSSPSTRSSSGSPAWSEN